MRSGILVKSLVIILFAGIMAAADVRAGEDKQEDRFIYQWTDKEGTVHITDDLGNVPLKFRSKARKIESGSAGEAAGESEQAQPMTPYPRANGEEASQKAQWQQRMKDAMRHLAEAEQRHQQLVEQKDALAGKYGGGTSVVVTPKGERIVIGGAPAAPEEVLAEIKLIEQKIEQAKKDIDNARDMIENVIPDEARRSGIPPGWLREVQ